MKDVWWNCTSVFYSPHSPLPSLCKLAGQCVVGWEEMARRAKGGNLKLTIAFTRHALKRVKKSLRVSTLAYPDYPIIPCFNAACSSTFQKRLAVEEIHCQVYMYIHWRSLPIRTNSQSDAKGNETVLWLCLVISIIRAYLWLRIIRRFLAPQ